MTPIEEDSLERKIERVAGMVWAAGRIVVFTGAGISTESGIPDFRSPGGIWDRYQPVEYHDMIEHEEARERYWIRSRETYPIVAAAKPNAAHLAVVELERMAKLVAVVTQNVDGLHQKAGNSPEKVIELHGNTHGVMCLSCRHRSPRMLWQPALERGLKVPTCPECGGILKIVTVSFGEMLPRKAMEAAWHAAETCDLMVTVGSTLIITPASELPRVAVESGAHLVIVNLTDTNADPYADVVIRAKAGEVLPHIVEGARGNDAAG